MKRFLLSVLLIESAVLNSRADAGDWCYFEHDTLSVYTSNKNTEFPFGRIFQLKKFENAYPEYSLDRVFRLRDGSQTEYSYAYKNRSGDYIAFWWKNDWGEFKEDCPRNEFNFPDYQLSFFHITSPDTILLGGVHVGISVKELLERYKIPVSPEECGNINYINVIYNGYMTSSIQFVIVDGVVGKIENLSNYAAVFNYVRHYYYKNILVQPCPKLRIGKYHHSPAIEPTEF